MKHLLPLLGSFLSLLHLGPLASRLDRSFRKGISNFWMIVIIIMIIILGTVVIYYILTLPSGTTITTLTYP